MSISFSTLALYKKTFVRMYFKSLIITLRRKSKIFRSVVVVTQNNRKMSSGVPLSEVVSKLTEYAPCSLAESWDNVGLLVEPSSPHVVRTMFLTNDLTEHVLNEAIDVSSDFILSYHPPIFRGVKKLTQDQWKDRLIVKAIENRIAIYSPHTTYDVVKGKK